MLIDPQISQISQIKEQRIFVPVFIPNFVDHSAYQSTALYPEENL